MGSRETELKGLEEIALLLVEKLTDLKKEAVIISDPSTKFQLKKQIQGLEKELAETKSQIKALSPSKKISSAVQCSGITKKGTRCKNKTKNESGRCYLHN